MIHFKSLQINHWNPYESSHESQCVDCFLALVTLVVKACEIPWFSWLNHAFPMFVPIFRMFSSPFHTAPAPKANLWRVSATSISPPPWPRWRSPCRGPKPIEDGEKQGGWTMVNYGLLWFTMVNTMVYNVYQYFLMIYIYIYTIYIYIYVYIYNIYIYNIINIRSELVYKVKSRVSGRSRI